MVKLVMGTVVARVRREFGAAVSSVVVVWVFRAEADLPLSQEETRLEVVRRDVVVRRDIESAPVVWVVVLVTCTLMDRPSRVMWEPVG